MKTVMIRRGEKVNTNIPTQYVVAQIKKGNFKGSDEISAEGTKWIRLDQHTQLAKYFKIQPIPNTQVSDSESKESTISHEFSAEDFAEEFDPNIEEPKRQPSFMNLQDNLDQLKMFIIAALICGPLIYWGLNSDWGVHNAKETPSGNTYKSKIAGMTDAQYTQCIELGSEVMEAQDEAYPDNSVKRSSKSNELKYQNKYDEWNRSCSLQALQRIGVSFKTTSLNYLPSSPLDWAKRGK